jgi:hypothetical protein
VKGEKWVSEVRPERETLWFWKSRCTYRLRELSTE